MPGVSAVPGGAARRIEPHRVDHGQIGCLGRTVPHLDVVAERGQVVGGDAGGHLVGVDGEDAHAERGEAQGIAADAAAQVGDPGQSRVAEAGCMAGRDRQSRGLLQACAREQHALCEVAELGVRPRTQPGLPDDGRHQVGGVPVAPQPRDDAGDVIRRFHAWQGVEQPEPLWRQEGGEFGFLHRASLCRGIHYPA